MCVVRAIALLLQCGLGVELRVCAAVGTGSAGWDIRCGQQKLARQGLKHYIEQQRGHSQQLNPQLKKGCSRLCDHW